MIYSQVPHGSAIACRILDGQNQFRGRTECIFAIRHQTPRRVHPNLRSTLAGLLARHKNFRSVVFPVPAAPIRTENRELPRPSSAAAFSRRPKSSSDSFGAGVSSNSRSNADRHSIPTARRFPNLTRFLTVDSIRSRVTAKRSSWHAGLPFSSAHEARLAAVCRGESQIDPQSREGPGSR